MYLLIKKQNASREKVIRFSLLFNVDSFDVVIWYFYEMNGRYPTVDDTLPMESFIKNKDIDPNWIDEELVKLFLLI